MLRPLIALYEITPTPSLWALPLFTLFAVLAALPVRIWLPALNVSYRDVRYTIPFLTQFWLFVTPVAYPASLIPERWRLLYGINPMVGVVEGFRWSLLGSVHPPSGGMAISLAAVIVLFISGTWYFRKME